MSIELRKKAKNNFKKYFFKLMNNVVFRKIMENVRKQRNQACNNQNMRELLSVRAKLSYNKTLSRKSIRHRNEKKTQIFMNKPVYLGISILEISKIVMHEFWYNNVKPKYGAKTNSCYMDTDSSIVYIKAEDIYSDNAKYVKTRYNTSSF